MSTVTIRRTINGIRHLIKHRRMPLFWVVAIIGGLAPWISPWSITLDPTGPGESCTVTSIYDGDTMTLKCDWEKVKVRMNCIDTPEMQQHPWGERSRDHLRSIAGRAVTLQRLDTDRYGRTIGMVNASDGTNLNLRMVEDGQAAVYAKYCKDSKFYEAQRAAKSDQLGIWRVPGLHQRPWEWRHK